MTEYQITKAPEKRTFQISDIDDEVIGKMTFPKWSIKEVEAVIDGDEYQIKGQSIWTSKFDIIRNQQPVGLISSNWRGHMLLSLTDTLGEEHKLKMIGKGAFKFKFQVENIQKHPLMFLYPKYTWTWGYNFRVEIPGYLDDGLKVGELVFISGFIANYYMHTMGGGG